jgi:TRAP-type C4-dicarboxylate transport system substrate-binding protein
VCDILWTSTGFFADMFPVSEIFFLPMVCSRGDSATNAWWDMYAETPEYWAEELDGYYPWMMYAIAHGTLGTKFYVESLDDLKGQSIRAAAGPVTDMVNAWGASPIMIPSSDMYTALEKGTISGYVFDVGGVNSFRWYEVTDYYLDCSFMNTTALVLINEDKWNQISPEDQAIINKYGLRDGSLEILDVHLKEQEAIIEELGDAYRYDTDSAFYQELKRIAEDVSDVWIERHTSSTIPMNELVVRAVERINQYES